MSLPKEPRQLMINLMYLVLTALLAMNVSSEILNAFKIVDKSINQSSKNITEKNDATIENFKIALEDPKIISDPIKFAKVKQFLEYAEAVMAKRKLIEVELEAYKQTIITRAGGMDPQIPGQILRQDDLDAATAIMIDEGNGAKMLATLTKYKADISAMVPADENLSLSGSNEALAKKLPLNFSVEESKDNPSKDWSYSNFHMVPAVGAVTIMDKYINDVKISESIVLDELWAKAFGERRRQVPVFKDYAILVSSPNSYLLPGEKYTAQVMLGAYNKTSNNLSIRVNGANLAVKDGIATYTATASGKGEQTINVSASYTDPNEETTKNYTGKATYFVGEAQATISLDKMNVFYIGVPNPITFSASGIAASNITYSSEGCTLTKRAEGVNQYDVTTTSGPGTIAKITLTGKLGDGTVKSFGTYPYRVKRIPDPYPLCANSRGGAIAANALKAQIAVFAKLDNFDFDAKFDVTSFDMFYQPKRGDPKEASARNKFLSGAQVENDVKDIMESLKPGDRLFIENIKAKGPDGTTRAIGALNFIINS